MSHREILEKINAHKMIVSACINISFDLQVGDSLESLQKTNKTIQWGKITPKTSQGLISARFVYYNDELYIPVEYRTLFDLKGYNLVPESTVTKHAAYSPLAIECLYELPVKGKTIFEAGCADGIPGIVCHALGAKKIIGFDNCKTEHGRCSPDWQQLHKLTIKINQCDEDKFSFYKKGIGEIEKTAKFLSQHQVNGIIANIGPWYPGNAHLDIIDIAAQVPSVEWIICGGYVQPNDKHFDNTYYPDSAIKHLANKGFEIIKYLCAPLTFIASGNWYGHGAPLCMLARKAA